MLISKVPDEDGGQAEVSEAPAEDDAHDYQTANELFELMVKNQNLNTSDVGPLTPRDLVLLYKNIDLGAKLMSGAKELKRGIPNQRVETVVYNDDAESDGSDISDVYSNEDLQNMILINKEQMDFMSQSSVGNTLCHKLGDLEIQTSINNEYDKQFLFKDPYIKEQLKSFNFLTNTNQGEGSVLPGSLLDYVCCKRLEDNYNFYMDNIIRYVKNTIEQLKRISNGDYLTDRAKEKWREVNNAEDASHNNTKVLATSTSIPLHVECKIDGLKSTWDDLVHSAVDVRSLSKILEKKIIVEIPKLIKGSYTLLSKCCADNLIISCKKAKQPIKDNNESRVDVVVQLNRSETGHVVSNISSIMILQTATAAQDPAAIDAPLPLMYKENYEGTNNCHNNEVKVTELDTFSNDNYEAQEGCAGDAPYDNLHYAEDHSSGFYSRCRLNRSIPSFAITLQDDITDSSDTLSTNPDGIQVYNQEQASFDDLRMTIQRLTMQSALPEESAEDMSQLTLMKETKTPARVRIKSPYENLSHIMEEKKRRKLLEIRERRERKKMALAESCKITKHKHYGKGGVMPQASSSVTKLSITNKSFYNSIYGQSTHMDTKQSKNRHRKREIAKVLEVALENYDSVHAFPLLAPLDTNNRKFINRSYYLDDTMTEMMYMNMKQQEKGIESASTSGISSDFRSNINIPLPLTVPAESRLYVTDGSDEKNHSASTPKYLLIGPSDIEVKQIQTKDLAASSSTLNIVPSNTPKGLTKTDNDKSDVKKITSSVECRKSIDKIYQLMTKLGKNQYSSSKFQNKVTTNPSTETDNAVDKGCSFQGNLDKGSSSVQGSESGTSIRHNFASSNPSTFYSLDKNSKGEILEQKAGSPTNVIPKVIISAKSQIPLPKSEVDKTKKDRKIVAERPRNKVPETNPLKAISQLLHEFENVQRNRLKTGMDKTAKKTDTTISIDGKTNSRQGPYKRRSRLEQHNDSMDSKYTRAITPKDKKGRPVTGMDMIRIPYQQVPNDDRYTDKCKKKINDILDEAKEARGEAVKGPSKFNSRLNSLAQPKKSYVQAHSEEYQHRYGRNLITDRLQRLAAAPSPPITERTTRFANPRHKIKRSSNEAVSTLSLKLPFQAGLPIERPVKQPRNSNNNSFESKERVSTRVGPSYKHVNMPETPEVLMKKMVAVESYVQNHYGHTSPPSSESLIQKTSRAPLLPNDIVTASDSSFSTPRGESTEVGRKLHRIIESMITSTSQGLEVLDECQETNFQSSTENIHENSLASQCSRCDEENSIDSDYTPTTGTSDHNGDVLTSSDNSGTVTFNIEQQHVNVEKANCKIYEVQPLESATAPEKNEHDLSRPLSVGTFSKRMNNLILTPKTSTQQLYLLQSGDAGSFVVKTSISQNSETEKLLNLKPVPILSKTHWDWNFSNIPMQITTVGYAFPEYNKSAGRPDSGSSSLSRLLAGVSMSSHKSSLVCQSLVNKSYSQNNNSIEKSNTDSQFCKREQLQPRVQEQAAQVDTLNLTSTTREENFYNSASQKPCPPNNESSKYFTSKSVTQDDADKNKTIKMNETKVTQTNILEEKSSDTSKKPDAVEYTTSLDILVGLLNEIQKITTCQTHITNSEMNECKDLEMILNKTAGIESLQSSACHEISFTSLDKLRCLESNQSIYSFYISDNDGQGRRDNIYCTSDIIHPWYEIKNNNIYDKPIHADKEVSADTTNQERVNKVTDIPSLFLPIMINHSTNITNSLLGEIGQSSKQSVFSFAECHSSYSCAASIKSTYSEGSSKKVLELLPQIIDMNVPNQFEESKEKVKKTKVNRLNKPETRSYIKGANIKKEVKKSQNNYLTSSNFDPVMRIKRDILVTVYSMLVLTVFAALSFPEVLYHVV